MAAAWLQLLAGTRPVRVLSAGTEPGTRVHPEVVTVMNEVGIDLTDGQPQQLSAAMLQEASDLITMGCGDVCIAKPAGVQCLDWPLPDPKGQPIDVVREIRDDIRQRVVDLLASFDLPAD